MLQNIDFVDVVAVGFGLILLGAIIAAYFTGIQLDSDLKSWFYAILTFFIGKKLPQSFNSFNKGE